MGAHKAMCTEEGLGNDAACEVIGFRVGHLEMRKREELVKRFEGRNELGVHGVECGIRTCICIYYRSMIVPG